MLSRQQLLDKDCDVMALVTDHVAKLQLRLQEASAAAMTDQAVDAISDLSLQLMDLMSDFAVVLAKVSHEANLANDRVEQRHNRSLHYPAA